MTVDRSSALCEIVSDALCSWLPAVMKVFKNSDDAVRTLKEKQLGSFCNCVTVAMSNQVFVYIIFWIAD